MKYFLDTEFIERGRQHPIELISIGIACEDGREFYAISREFKSIYASKWVQDNVLKPLLLDTATPRESISVIASAIQGFVGDEHPEFWGYYCDYDWVVFCQLFGAMIDLPKGWPMYCRDLKQRIDEYGNPKIPFKPDAEHDALSDARWNKKVYDWLEFLRSKAEEASKNER